MTILTDLGYDTTTRFRFIGDDGEFPVGTELTVCDDDDTRSPEFIDAQGNRAYLNLPGGRFKADVEAITSETDTANHPTRSASGVSDGSTADYYRLPDDATDLQDLISHRDMNAQLGEIFRAAYRYGAASHSDKLRDAKKIRFYIEAEIDRLEKLNATD